MKKMITSAIFTLSFIGSIQFAQAEDAKNTSTLQDPHHVEGSAKTDATKDASKMMDMNGMKSMMSDCMTMNKDGKMCDHETMTKCEEKMGQADCTKMMKKMKSAKMNSNMNTK